MTQTNGNTDHRDAVIESATGRKLRPGIIPPAVTFFKPDETIDEETIGKHNVGLLEAGCSAVVVMGSNGELQNILDRSEKAQIVSATRAAFDKAGYKDTPIIVGCSAMSTIDAIRNVETAHQAGGDFALVLPPSFYHQVVGKPQIIQFYKDIADKSPIPIIIYNYPAAVAGIDLSSDDILTIAQHPKVVGVKLTCGNTGKVPRLALPPAAGQKGISHPFFTLAGTADWLIQGLSVGAKGCVPGLANVIPRVCVKAMEAFQAGDMKEALRLQAVLSRADTAAQVQNLVGTKCAVNKFHGYGGGICRRPLASQIPEEWYAAWEEGIAEERKFQKLAQGSK